MGSRTIAAAVVAASVAAVGLAGPAFATDEYTLNEVGTYEFEGKSLGPYTWIASPCEGDAPQCIEIAEFDTDDVARANPHWRGNAHWRVGSWIMFVVVPNAIECEDGTEHDFRVNYSWDAVEDTGWRSFNDPGICGGDPETVALPFKLNRLGPPPLPLPGGASLPPPAAAEAPPPGNSFNGVPIPPVPVPGPPLPPGAAEAPPAPAPVAAPSPPP
ncbi:MAG: hypothetical protein ACPGVG_12285, partial [Mycobacterium sp.]